MVAFQCGLILAACFAELTLSHICITALCTGHSAWVYLTADSAKQSWQVHQYWKIYKSQNVYVLSFQNIDSEHAAVVSEASQLSVRACTADAERAAKRAAKHKQPTSTATQILTDSDDDWEADDPDTQQQQQQQRQPPLAKKPRTSTGASPVFDHFAYQASNAAAAGGGGNMGSNQALQPIGCAAPWPAQDPNQVQQQFRSKYQQGQHAAQQQGWTSGPGKQAGGAPAASIATGAAALASSAAAAGASEWQVKRSGGGSGGGAGNPGTAGPGGFVGFGRKVV